MVRFSSKTQKGQHAHSFTVSPLDCNKALLPIQKACCGAEIEIASRGAEGVSWFHPFPKQLKAKILNKHIFTNS
jgi:hypothetical protein